jgi:hypothetical protein
MAGRDVICTLGGQTRTLRFSLSAWVAAERAGYKIDALMQQITELSMVATATCIWAMLQDEVPPPTLAQVTSWIDGENFAEIVTQMGEALRVAFPSPPSPPSAAPPSP